MNKLHLAEYDIDPERENSLMSERFVVSALKKSFFRLNLSMKGHNFAIQHKWYLDKQQTVIRGKPLT